MPQSCLIAPKRPLRHLEWRSDSRGAAAIEGNCNVMVEDDAGAGGCAVSGPTRASVIVPAHNEAAVIARTLAPLVELASRDAIEVIVVCNGCTDDTAVVAGGIPGITVLSTDVPSKTNALNLGDARAAGWPRIYLDADIEVTPNAILAVAQELTRGPALAGRPSARYDVTGSSALVRWYYAARARVPSLHQALWGAGCYAVSQCGHERIGQFPPLKGDDLWVDGLFSSDEKLVVETDPVIVRAPRTLKALLAITRRNVTGTHEQSQGQASGPTYRRTVTELLGSVRGLSSARDAFTFAVVAVLARISLSKKRWERDDTSRS